MLLLPHDGSGGGWHCFLRRKRKQGGKPTAKCVWKGSALPLSCSWGLGPLLLLPQRRDLPSAEAAAGRQGLVTLAGLWEMFGALQAHPKSQTHRAPTTTGCSVTHSVLAKAKTEQNGGKGCFGPAAQAQGLRSAQEAPQPFYSAWHQGDAAKNEGSLGMLRSKRQQKGLFFRHFLFHVFVFSCAIVP